MSKHRDVTELSWRPCVSHGVWKQCIGDTDKKNCWNSKLLQTRTENSLLQTADKAVLKRSRLHNRPWNSMERMMLHNGTAMDHAVQYSSPQKKKNSPVWPTFQWYAMLSNMLYDIIDFLMGLGVVTQSGRTDRNETLYVSQVRKSLPQMN